MRIKVLFVILVVVTSIVACEDPYKGSTFTAFQDVPAATYLKEHPEYSLWSDMIEHAGLFRTLNLDRVYTFFVPNDSAVEVYLDANGYSDVTDMEPEDAAYLIRYHLLSGIEFDQSQFQNGVVPRATETDDDLTIEFRDGGLNEIYLNGVARFVQLDIEVTNGIIHEIDAVLVPITASVEDVLSGEDYTIFNEAVIATGYSDDLATIYDIDTIEGTISSKRYQFTVFAVTDSIYQADGISSFDDLVSQLGAGSDYDLAENELNKYVSYHILGTLKSTASLATFPDGETSTNINTMAENQIISLTSQGGVLIINYDQALDDGIHFVEENIACRNGVIHEVDGWMPLFTPPQVTVLWDLADHSDIASLCTSYQRSDLSNSYYERTFIQEELDSYTWESTPEDLVGVVAYRNNRINDGVFYFTLNYDHMRFRTGPSGWVETETPVIIQGTYKITLGYISRRNTSNTGIMLASLDGRQLGNQLVTSNTDQDKRLEHVLSQSFDFAETKSHTLRIVGVDGKLLTLDYIRFEPIE